MDPTIAPGLWPWHAGHWWREPWTLWTAALGHLGPWHLLANLLAMVALAGLAWQWRLRVALLLAPLLALPLAVLGLLAWPTVTHYQGLSVLTHALAAMLVVLHLARDQAQHTRPGWPVLLLGMGLLLKLALERGWSAPLAPDPGWGFAVVQAAHLSGALAGAGCAVLIAGANALRRRIAPTQRFRRRAPPPPARR